MSTHKKVLYITYDGMTDPLGQSQVIPYLQILSSKGYEITLLSAEKKDRFQKGRHIIEKILADSNISWAPIMFTSRPPLLAKMIDQWKLNRKAAELHNEKKFDFIHCRSYVPAAAAIKLKRRYGVPFLFDMRGFWVDERVDNGQWNLSNPLFKILYRVYKKKEKVYLREAGHLITLTSKGRKELINVYKVPEEKISVIPCSADLEHFDYRKIVAQQKAALRKELQIADDKKILSYLGSLGGWYLTNEMLDFFKVLHGNMPNTIFLFITHHSEKEIMSFAAAKGIDPKNIRVKPASRLEVPAVLSVSDWSVFFIKDAYSKRASSPTKQGEIMAMGIPVICNDIGDTGEITEQASAGFVVNSFSEKEYERAVKYLAGHGDFNSEQIRRSAFIYYDLQKAGAQYTRIYQAMLQLPIN